MSLELIKKYDCSTLLPKPKLKFGTPIITETDPFLISEYVWKDQAALDLNPYS